MRFVPRDYQQIAIQHAVEFLRSAEPGNRRLYAAPTGSGKSVIELCVQAALIGAWIVTPVVEIIAGLLDKLDVDTRAMSEDRLIAAAFDRHITTPIRFRNLLLRGEGEAPRYLILDEAHHHNADTWQQLDLLAGLPPCVGYTATPYRGTPRGTAALRERWGEPVWILTYPEAVARGVIAMPACRIVPILDDDLVEVQNGEFVVSAVEAATPLDEVVKLAAPFCAGGVWDRPTMFACPSTMLASIVTRELAAAGFPARCVVGDSSRMFRDAAFCDAVDRRAALVQVKVVGEGVDLPIRRLVDLSPAISPVAWLQRFGRVTRPVPAGEPAPEYVCCNRNLLRHAYLLDGCLPAAAVIDAQKQFGAGTRNGYRVLGLEGLGRFKETKVPLRSGLEGFLYCMSAVEGLQVVNYATFVHPTLETPIWAKRVDAKQADGTRKYGRWQRAEQPDDLAGFASIPASNPTPKQLAWWERDAERYGLDASLKPNRRTFQILPILADLGLRVKA
jgi:hypothetical protein